MKQTVLLANALFLLSLFSACSTSKNSGIADNHRLALPALSPIPDSPDPLPPGTVEMGDPDDYEEVKMTFPMMDGPYEPTWQSIHSNYPGNPEWFKHGKFGFWVHFGPQAAGESGDWYARRMYMENENAYKNQIKNHGHSSETGYKDILVNWNPDKFDPSHYVRLYKEAGARFIMIQGVHHDNFDLWDSDYQPWNSVNLGPKRDYMREWAEAIRKENLHYGITFHHEYTWWWWQTAFWSDKSGPKAGIQYDGRKTIEDGKGTPWEGYDPRMLHGIDLNEYIGMDKFQWMPPKGIFHRHLKYANWYANNWALRILDAVNKYDPDFIYTDGTTQQPFCGIETGTGYKCDAMQRVIASYYNQRIKRHGKVDAFTIVKFRKDEPNKIVTTSEAYIPGEIRKDQTWIGENAVGDWYYTPDITYSSDALIRYMLEIISRDGYYMVNIPFKPDGSIDEECENMLKEVGKWMKINGEGIYGSRSWKKLGEGKDGTIRSFPNGHLNRYHADFKFSINDFRFTEGEDGSLYAYCMTVPEPNAKLQIKSLGLETDLKQKIKAVKLLGYKGKVQWKQFPDQLEIVYPEGMDLKTSVCFKIEQ